MTESRWGLGKRVGFRWAFVFGALLVYPFPLHLIPKTEWLVEIVTTPRSWAVRWFAQSILGLPDPPSAFTGSGDRTFDYVALLLFACLAVLGAIAWSAVDRRRTAYPRLAAGARVVLRYYVASAEASGPDPRAPSAAAARAARPRERPRSMPEGSWPQLIGRSHGRWLPRQTSTRTRRGRMGSDAATVTWIGRSWIFIAPGVSLSTNFRWKMNPARSRDVDATRRGRPRAGWGRTPRP